jgi:hypothetical protein
MALCVKLSEVTVFSNQNLNLYSYIPRFYCYAIAYIVTKTPLPPHEFAYPPLWYKRLLNIAYYGIRLPSNGIMLWRKIIIIREFIPLFLVDGYVTNSVCAWHFCCPIFPSWVERIMLYTQMSINTVKNYSPVIDLIMEYFCFSHVKRLAALSLWPKYLLFNIKLRFFPGRRRCLLIVRRCCVCTLIYIYIYVCTSSD